MTPIEMEPVPYQRISACLNLKMALPKIWKCLTPREKTERWFIEERYKRTLRDNHNLIYQDFYHDDEPDNRDQLELF